MAFDETDVFFSDWRTTVQFGEIQTIGMLDMPDTSISLGGVDVASGNVSLLYGTKTLPGLKKGDTLVITVDRNEPINYRVSDPPDSLDDGVLSRAKLMKTSGG